MTTAPSAPLREEVLAGAAPYTSRILSTYDTWVLGFVCPVVWGCPRDEMLRQYNRSAGARHLDLGPGTGWFLERATFPTLTPELVLADLNEGVLRRAGGRVAHLRPRLVKRDVLQPLDLGEDTRFDSAALNMLLHCLPGRMSHKLTVLDQVRPYMAPGGRIFGSTVLAKGVRHGRLAPRALENLNKDDGPLNNLDDSLEDLEAGIADRFDDYRIAVRGSIALFDITVG
ncbi:MULTISPECIES: class I SAM-dependent methyltransferase [unclassified Streptomyces]|uniref:class I SAM-dependent methyltransferase n=1 Tax=Streptomyces sp. cf386 TaxID=1761904 RepID=UPI000887C5B4|nr:class I SAM-dependent methyltransferase [Streptomyces sp. cf386]SDP01341.1 Methyltransferase domain-containing protein [Streptomyces sp. cf386]